MAAHEEGGPRPLSMTISMQMRVNLGNYESADCFMSISGVTKDTTEDELVELLDGNGKITYDALKVRVYDRARELRKERGGGGR